ncbi:hypothetical protein PYCCODRAFT_158305 [Trametes coccinea BRFM310]|uniref:Uncharacterized protein n=1 Tax=Trametes coccinea (strain BRFM310) TaxID=1353009 RepID=A0A1Y2IUN7_TRAC3|nr:hypothetical protein PYCCODRAFT_158305 [Trametes coccinea BRFM310]
MARMRKRVRRAHSMPPPDRRNTQLRLRRRLRRSLGWLHCNVPPLTLRHRETTTHGCLSRRRTFAPRSRSVWAAERPARPPPTTMTWDMMMMWRIGRVGRMGEQG